jgi:CRP-like cAMP-binding protein
VLDTGMFFGEVALADDAPEPATISALTPMRLRVATRLAFVQLVVMPPFARALVQTLAAYERLAYDDGASSHSVTSGKLARPSDETASGGCHDRQVGVHG